MRVARRVVGVQPHHRQQFIDAGRARGAIGHQVVTVQPLRDDVGDFHARVQARVRILKNHLGLAPKRAHRRTTFAQARDVLTCELDRPAGRLIQADQAAAGGGFARTGLADQPQRLAFIQVKTDILDRAHLIRPTGVEGLHEVAHCHQHSWLSHSRPLPTRALPTARTGAGSPAAG